MAAVCPPALPSACERAQGGVATGSISAPTAVFQEVPDGLLTPATTLVVETIGWDEPTAGGREGGAIGWIE
jgi:hypothetical protein